MRLATRGWCAATIILSMGAATAAQAQDSPGVRILNASPYSIAADTELSDFVTETAQAAIAEHCAGCHGADLAGGPGVPDLTDYDWLWGITGEETNDVYPVMAIRRRCFTGCATAIAPRIK